jgi:ABC-2 type transport system permease protein
VTIAKAVLKSWMRSREGLFFSILFPLMLLLIFGSVFSGAGGDRPYGIYVQNHDLLPDGTPPPLTSAFLQALNSSGGIRIIEFIPADVPNPVQYAQARLGFFSGPPRVMVLPKGFGESLVNSSRRAQLSITTLTIQAWLRQYGQYMEESQRLGAERGLAALNHTLSQLPSSSPTIILILDPTQASTPIVKGIITGLAHSFNYQLMGAQPNLNIQEQPHTQRSYRAVEYYLPGILGAFIMTNGVIGVGSNTADFKRRGVLKRLATTPLTKLEWVLGNIMAQSIMGLLLTALMMLTGYIVFGVSLTPHPLTLALLTAGSICFSGIGLIIAGALKDVEAVTAAGNMIAFPMMFLSGSFIPLEMMPTYLQSLAQLLPLTYLSNGLKATLILGDQATATLSLIIVSIIAAAAIVSGALLTRWHEK